MKNFENFLDTLEENTHNREPPAVLTLKRQTVRQYPDGSKIALYWSDDLKRMITIPFSNGIISQQFMEDAPIGYSYNSEAEEDEENSPPEKKIGYISDIVQAARNAIKTNEITGIKFANGGTYTIDKTTATLLLNVFERLNKRNKWKINLLINQSLKNYLNIIKFAIKNQG
jgi:hypothetical protein